MKGKSHIGIVLKKEIKDMLRDRRTIFAGLLLPVILYPMMFLLMGTFITGITDAAENDTRVAVAGSPAAYEFVRDTILAGVHGITVTDRYDGIDGAMSEGGPDLFIAFEPDDIDLLRAGSPVGLKVIYESEKMSATASMQVLAGAINAYNGRVTTEKLAEFGLTLEGLTPLHIEAVARETLAGEKSGGAGMMMNMMLPMIIVLFLTVGGMNVAMDLFAGEKERHTMEALLCTRAGRGDILIGKLIAVVLYSLAAVVSSVAGMVIAYSVAPALMSIGTETDVGGGLGVGAGALALMVVIVALLAVLFAALQVMVSCWSRTVKEAGTYSVFFMLVSNVPVFATMMMSSGDFERWMAFVPVLNVLGCLKMILAGVTNYSFMLISLAMTAAFLGAALLGTRAMFKNETVVLR
ncbi:MAG: ABC transporter permease subunit [Oscillospiraceae bacterium]|nr:ABC transporter permease subunit [Oscillospiraceae bacterium]